jgi:hypothetical protein
LWARWGARKRGRGRRGNFVRSFAHSLCGVAAVLRCGLFNWEHCWNVFCCLDSDLGFKERRWWNRSASRFRWLGFEYLCLPVLQLRFQSVLAFFDGLKSFQKSHEVWMLLIRHGLDLHERATAGSSD